MTTKTKFYCYGCHKEKPIADKSPNRLKPPGYCVDCDTRNGNFRAAAKRLSRENKPKQQDPAQEHYASGRNAEFFKKLNEG